MAVTKKIQIQNASGTGYDSRNIGAEAEYVDVSRDSNGDIITDLETQTVDSTESLAQTLKNLEDDTAIDSALSTTSEHAVQNKVVTGELNKKIPTYTSTPASWDTTPTKNSTKPVTSGGVYDALQGVGANDNFIGTVAEWEALTDAQKEQYKTVDFTDDFNGATIDAVPTQNSTNAVSSGGVYDALQDVNEAIAIVAEEDRNIHNIPRVVPKDITEYVTDGTLWKRLEGTDGFELFEDLFVGDYIHMSRPISAYNQNQTYQETGSEYVTIAGIDILWGNGDNNADVPNITYHHLVMIPGQGLAGTEHFGRSRMNPTNTTTGGYVGSEMFTTTIGPVTSTGSTATTATINEQLYAEFGSHLKTIRELLTNAIIASGASATTGYNRFGTNSGCAAGWEWTSVQACLMSEIEVYGSIVWNSTGFDTGTGKVQFPLFEHSETDVNDRTSAYWLRGVASGTYFCRVDNFGGAHFSFASAAGNYVRPRFVLGA